MGCRYVYGIQSTGLGMQHGRVGPVLGGTRPAGGGANVAQAPTGGRIDLGKRGNLDVRHCRPTAGVLGRLQAGADNPEPQNQDVAPSARTTHQ